MKRFTTKSYNNFKEHLALAYWNYSMAFNQMGKFLTSWPVRHQIKQAGRKTFCFNPEHSIFNNISNEEINNITY